MMTFRSVLLSFKLPMSTVWLLSDIAEAKGRQDLYIKQSPQILKALRELAMVESVESSNRIEESKEDYYAVLHTSSTGWHEGRHELLPWLNYFLAILRRAYVRFEERAGQVKSPRGAKTALILAAIRSIANPFRVADLQDACPGVSIDWIRKVLKDLRAEGKVECLGRGQQARWNRLPDELGNT